MSKQSLTVPPGEKIRLKKFDAGYCENLKKPAAIAASDEYIEQLSSLAARLYAENQRSLLLVLQGTDTSGKDGTIRHVMRGVDPQSCLVTSFKQPSIEELDHDFLWRVANRLPPRGSIGIFNRSHYEDVGIVRVLKLVPEKEWKSRFDRINRFEQLVVDSGTTILKVFLHVSKDEQRQRLQERVDDPTKNWKFNKGDLEQRKYWDDYVEAYEDALTKCNTEAAPWYIVPADHKWYRNLAISRLLVETLTAMNPKYPPADPEIAGLVIE